MKKMIFLSFFVASSCFAQEFQHARPDTMQMITESAGLLEVNVEKCNVSKEEKEKILKSLDDMQEVVHFYAGVSYEDIKNYQQQSKEHYTKNFTNEYCEEMKEMYPELIRMPESFNLEQLYAYVQNMPKNDLPKLNQEYIYKNKFISRKFTDYSAGQNQDGTIWIGKTMNEMQCMEKAARTKGSSMPTYCDAGYAKIKVFIH